MCTICVCKLHNSIKVILYPQNTSLFQKKKKKRERILEFSVDIVMDLFWFSRNQVIHNSIKFDIGNLLKDK